MSTLSALLKMNSNIREPAPHTTSYNSKCKPNCRCRMTSKGNQDRSNVRKISVLQCYTEIGDFILNMLLEMRLKQHVKKSWTKANCKSVFLEYEIFHLSKLHDQNRRALREYFDNVYIENFSIIGLAEQLATVFSYNNKLDISPIVIVQCLGTYTRGGIRFAKLMYEQAVNYLSNLPKLSSTQLQTMRWQNAALDMIKHKTLLLMAQQNSHPQRNPNTAAPNQIANNDHKRKMNGDDKSPPANVQINNVNIHLLSASNVQLNNSQMAAVCSQSVVAASSVANTLITTSDNSETGAVPVTKDAAAENNLNRQLQETINIMMVTNSETGRPAHKEAVDDNSMNIVGNTTGKDVNCQSICNDEKPGLEESPMTATKKRKLTDDSGVGDGENSEHEDDIYNATTPRLYIDEEGIMVPSSEDDIKTSVGNETDDVAKAMSEELNDDVHVKLETTDEQTSTTMSDCFCGKGATAMCSCKGVWYCSSDCQSMDWPQHKLICNFSIAAY